MADDCSTSISNQEGFERYVMKVKSNVEAARRFMNDEGIVDEPIGLDRWVCRFRRLRSRWAKLSKRQKSKSTRKVFMEFQQERFLNLILPMSQLLLRVQMNMKEMKWKGSKKNKMKQVPAQLLHSMH